MQDIRAVESSLRRALRLLDSFSPEHPELSVRELAHRSGVPRSTAHRLMQELVAWGGVERGARGYRLGVKLFELGTMAPTQTTLREAASPFLHTLTDVTGLTVNLGVRDGATLVYLEKIGVRSLRVPHSRLGGRGVLHATGLGKALLAFADPGEVDSLIAGPLTAVTSKTIVEADALRTELGRVRRERLAYDVEESRLGLFCVAAPILDSSGRALAAISVTGATALAQAERFGPAVSATARTVEQRLSGRHGGSYGEH